MLAVGYPTVAFADDGSAPTEVATVNSEESSSLVEETSAATEAPQPSTEAPAEEPVSEPQPEVATEVPAPPAEPVVVDEPVAAPVVSSEPAEEATTPEVAPEEPSSPPVAAPTATQMKASSPAPAAKKPDTAKKVWVCKFVGTPGVNERLKSGKNPISVSVNSIGHNTWNGSVPGWFSDAHDRSFVIAYDTGGSGPSAADCEGVIVKKDASASVSVTPATCDAPAKLVYGEAVNATLSGTPNGTAGPGNYNVTATSTSGHVFADGTSSQLFSGTLDGKIPTQNTNPNGPCYEPPVLVKDASASVSVTPATCDAPAMLVYGDVAHASFSGTANGTTGPGSYDVTATSDTGHAFSDGELTKSFTGTLDGKLPSQSENPEGSCYEPPAPTLDASASVSVTPATCDAPSTLVYGDIENATFSGTPDGTTGPGDYSVVATSDEGHLFADESSTKSFSGTLADKLPTQSEDPEGSCYEPSVVLKDAEASVTVTLATCDVPAKLVYGEVVNATFDGTADGTNGPGDYTMVATANEGHLFADESATQTFSGTLSGKLPQQSVDPAKPCFKALVPPSNPPIPGNPIPPTPPATPVSTPHGQLAVTGTGSADYSLLIALGLVTLSGLAFSLRRRNKVS